MEGLKHHHSITPGELGEYDNTGGQILWRFEYAAVLKEQSTRLFLVQDIALLHFDEANRGYGHKCSAAIYFTSSSIDSRSKRWMEISYCYTFGRRET